MLQINVQMSYKNRYVNIACNVANKYVNIACNVAQTEYSLLFS